VRVAARIFLPALAALSMACETSSPDRPVTTSTNTNVVTPKVSWPSGTKGDARAFASLGDPSRAAELLARSPVPVLAPTTLSFDRPTFVIGAEYYALTGHVDGATIAIQGTRAAHRYEDIAPVAGDRVLRGVRGFVSMNEGIRTTSWIENGVAYSLDVECSARDDARCSSDAFAVELVEHLAFAGGR
jgi:hypothetical protein